MVGLSILKHVENLSDDVLVNRWVQNPYYQMFCGETVFSGNCSGLIETYTSIGLLFS